MYHYYYSDKTMAFCSLELLWGIHYSHGNCWRLVFILIKYLRGDILKITAVLTPPTNYLSFRNTVT